MRLAGLLLCLPCLLLGAISAQGAVAGQHHALTVTIQPADHTLSVSDQISLTADSGPRLEFSLHAGLNPVASAGRQRLADAHERTARPPAAEAEVLFFGQYHRELFAMVGAVLVGRRIVAGAAAVVGITVQ